LHGGVIAYGVFVFLVDYAIRFGIGGIVLSGYLLSVVGTVLLCAVLTAILPEGKTSGIIKGVTKLACLLAVIAPIPKFLQNYRPRDETGNTEITDTFFSESVIQTDKTFIQYYSERRIELAERALKSELQEKFGYEIDVEMEWTYYTENALSVYEDSEILITKIKLSGKNCDEEAKMSVAAYVSKHYCSEVLIE
jgi:hypothetical protein